MSCRTRPPWGPDKWDVNYRDNNRINCYDTRHVPVQDGVPGAHRRAGLSEARRAGQVPRGAASSSSAKTRSPPYAAASATAAARTPAPAAPSIRPSPSTRSRNSSPTTRIRSATRAETAHAPTSQSETARCLGCGASWVDPNKCIGCGVCTTKCALSTPSIKRDHPECSHYDEGRGQAQGHRLDGRQAPRRDAARPEGY